MYPSVSQLDSFTNIFEDEVEENLSQPLSLPSTCETVPESSSNALSTSCMKTYRPLKHTGQHGEFRSVEEIDPKYRSLFTYPYFNLVQSRIIEDALYSDKSMVVCAPTGSGKTVVFELAILQLLMQMEDNQNTGDFKIIYMAPVKAVCNERLTEWYPKLTKLGILCLEVTGDTEVDFAQLKPYKLIITTPEKWDILTRRWRDHRGLVEMIKLFLIDEVHILNDETRGPVLEAVVSRMKTVESAAQSAHRIEQLQKQYQGEASSNCAPPRIRFVAVSATVSNPEDVADWLGTSEKPAVFYKFGDECRPVKLKRIVEGYPCAEGTSIFKFDLILNYKLWPIIQKYYNGKPTLIFCNTRKSVTLTAEALSREVTVSFSPEQKAKLTALASTLKNKKLQMLAMSGVGCHHAGLLYEERVNIERAFRNRDLPILITTTTLAMGVNLPAHLVIVKNTQQYVNGAYQEYSISTVLQMVGRAGRPQFDTEATAVIMTRLSDKPRYQALVGGSEPLQSYLHKRIAENLNSEAALGTVTDVAQCVEWLRSTFLYVRAAKDPKRYLGLPPAAPMQHILKKIEELCVKAMNGLASSGLITMDEASCIESTEAGRLMSLFYLDVETMKNIMKIEGTESLERLLWILCESHELSDMHLRVDERRCLNLLNRNNTAATIRYPMKGKISTRQMKLNCIIQATLGCLVIPEPSLNQEAMKVMRTASRVCKCLVKYVTRPELVSQQPQVYMAVLNSVVLSKCIEAHLWENSPYVSKQLKGIGATFSTLLASAGVTSFMLLEESHPRDLERIMNKGPPAGNMIRKQVSLLPKYQLTVTPIDSRSVSVQLILLNQAHLSENINHLTAGDNHKSYLIIGDSENNLLLLTQFTDKDLISIYDGTMKYEITRKLSCEHRILIHCVSSVIVGIDVHTDYLFLDLQPQLPRESNFFSCSNTTTPNNIAEKQTAITDTYRQRKRKSNCDSDITQSKEKIKRENTLTQKLKALKDCFGKTSKSLKKDIDNTTGISNKLLHDLLDGQSVPTNNSEVLKNVPVENPVVDLTKEIVTGPSEEIIINDDDDYIDDIQIDSILSKIESEISEINPTAQNVQNANNIHDVTVSISPNNEHEITRQADKFQTKYRSTNKLPHFLDDSTISTFSKHNKNSVIRKSLNKKTNFAFIDLIEKKANTNEEENVIHKAADNGFSDTIKSEINKFLQREHSKTNQVLPEINELIQSSEEDPPEVHIKSTMDSEKTVNINISEQDSSETNNNVAQGVNIAAAHENSSEANHCYGEIHDIMEEHANAVQAAEPNISPENLLQPDCIKPDRKSIKSSKIKVGTDSKEIITHDEKYNKSNCLILTTGQRNPSTAITDYSSPNTSDSSNLMNHVISKTSADNKSYKIAESTSVEKTANNYKDLVPYHKQNDNNSTHQKDLMPYNNTDDDNNIYHNDAFSQNFLMPCQDVSLNRQDSSIFDQNDMMIVDKLMIEYENIDQKVPHNIENCYNTNSVTSSAMVPAALNVTNIKSGTCNKDYSQAKSPDSRSPFNVPSINRSEHMPNTHAQVDEETHNNQQGTRFKRYSYTATKVDVCTKKYSPDHELRITRRLKLDVDVTEIVKQGNVETSKANPDQQIVNRSQEQNTCVDAITRKVNSNELKPYLRNIHRSEKSNVIDRHIPTEDKKEIIQYEQGKTVIACKSMFEEDMTSYKISRKNADISVNDEHNRAVNRNTTRIPLKGTDDIPKESITNNSVGNILQKYSKILVKPQPTTPTVNKMNKSMSSNSTGIYETETKSRKPFRIGEINNLNVPLPTSLISSTKSTLQASMTNPIQVVDLIKNEPAQPHLAPELRIDEPILTFNCDNNDKSYESPASVASLQLDPIQDIKEENMLNPKLLLQYFSDDNKETDIIAPPAPFSDNPAYSPATSPEVKREVYEGFSDWNDNIENMDKIYNELHDENKENDIETWCLSRDDECDMYTSQPVPSAPWIISRQGHSSQANANPVSRRAKLCQFKFVRKKPLKP